VKIASGALGATLRGVGLEIGSGCGLLASTVALSPDVEYVYALEICEDLVRLLMPRVSKAVLGEQFAKVISVRGSFDELELPDDSIDFIVEIDSLHHSDDLRRTLRECSRVLRPGGQMMILDRCHPDSLPDEEVERMLSEVYSEDFLRKNHYPPGITLTRRDNGEHEYRLREWLAAFRDAGLEVVRARKLVREIRPALAAKGLLAIAPRALTRRLYQTNNASLRTTFDWVMQARVLTSSDPYFGRAVLAPKSTTAFLLTKQA
jgi:ubiquinone/menaquinone biosynthesis C-methylase UbiE